MRAHRDYLNQGATLPGLIKGDCNRIIVEAYPGVIAKRLIGRRSYKQDNKKKQSVDQSVARKNLLFKILRGDCYADYRFRIEASYKICADPTGDQLDALLCAMQAAWAWKQRKNNYGTPVTVDHIEGWIADPITCDKMNKEL